MAVFRVQRDRNFTTMSNYHLRDRSISLKAKGLLSQMLSLPEDWDYTLSGLAAINKEGKDAIRSALAELEQAGYVHRRQLPSEGGRFGGNEFLIFEHPVKGDFSTHPLWGSPVTKKPASENPTSENPTQRKIHPQKKEKQKTDLQRTEIHPRPEKDELWKSLGKTPAPVSHSDSDEDRIFWLERVKKQVDYERLLDEFPELREQIEYIVRLMARLCRKPEDNLRIGGVKTGWSTVKDRLQSLTPDHVIYVLECLYNSEPSIRNRKMYLLTALYHAPETMDAYYDWMVG